MKRLFKSTFVDELCLSHHLWHRSEQVHIAEFADEMAVEDVFSKAFGFSHEEEKKLRALSLEVSR